MFKTKTVFVIVAVLSFLTIVFAQESPEPAVNVAVIRNGVKAESVVLSKGRIQINALHKKYDDPAKTYNLTGNSAVTIIQSDKNLLRLTGKDGDIIQVQAARIEDQIDAGGQIEVDHFAPIRDLSQEIRTYPFLTSYRVKWYFSVFTFHSAGVALYDRESKTIREYIREGDWDTVGYSHLLYTGVTDEILHQMAQDVKDKNPKAGQPYQTAPFDFGHLTRYGCKIEKLK